jgi:hypothetical protein
MVLGSACDSGSDGGEQIEERMGVLNDTVLQGPGLVLQGPGLVLQGPGLVLQGPGLVLQGPGLVLQGPGLVLQGVDFQGPGLVLQGPGLVLQGPGLVLQGTEFAGTFVKDGVTYELSGMDFIGAEFDLRLTAIVNGQQVVEEVILRINNITVSEQQDDVLVYDLTYRPKNSSNGWLPYCGANHVPAVPLKNYWDGETGDRIDDPNVVTFACTNAVLAKCTLWGYKPWATADKCDPKDKKNKGKKCDEVSLTDHHQACTRMARADYCGDGTPATVDGTLIDIWDNLAPPVQTKFTDWKLEAEWTPEGASCLNYVRHPEFGYPACFLKKGKAINKCGKTPMSDSLTFNAYSAP